MRIFRPYLGMEIPGDKPMREEGSSMGIMAATGELLGFSRTRAVWRYGFIPDSPEAKAHGVSVPQFLFVLSEHNGNRLASFSGFGCELPKRFTRIIDMPARQVFDSWGDPDEPHTDQPASKLAMSPGEGSPAHAH